MSFVYFVLSATICRHPIYLSVRISTRMLQRTLQYAYFQPEVCHVIQHLTYFVKFALSAIALTVLFETLRPCSTNLNGISFFF